MSQWCTQQPITKAHSLLKKSYFISFKDFFKTVSSNLAWTLYFSSPIPVQLAQSPHRLHEKSYNVVNTLRAGILRITFNTIKV